MTDRWADILAGGGLVVEAGAAVWHAYLHGQVLKLENWGYSNPNPDILRRTQKVGRFAWALFAAGILMQLAALIFRQ